jgi:transposase-like protein
VSGYLLGAVMNLSELVKITADETKAVALFEGMRWPNGPYCPHCGGTDRLYDLSKTRLGLKKCGHCRKQFTARVGTIFEDSPLPISKWLLAIHLMCSSKKGVSAKQIERELGITYKSAWYLCHRIRLAMTKEPLASKLGGAGEIVEADATYVGGKAGNNKHKGYKAKPKSVVLTLVERDGEVRAFPVPAERKGVLHPIMQANIDGAAHIMTDKSFAYPGLKKHFASHHAVNHSMEYVRGIVHTNFAESFHSLLKRGIFGTFHHVSAKHLERYLKEFEFRWNSRKATDGARFAEAVKGVSGKRLTYRPLTNNAD